MTGPRPLIVVSLPARSVADARSMVRIAKAAGGDAAEVRFDLFSETECDRARELFPSPLPLMATYRSTAEGGTGSSDPGERQSMLSEIERLPFAWIDREIRRDLDPDAPVASRPDRPATIGSIHLSADCSPAEIRTALETRSKRAVWTKVVIPASLTRFWAEILPIVEAGFRPDRIVLTTGPSGPLLRVWSRRYGFPGVFAALPEADQPGSTPPVEPAQIPVDRLRPFLESDPPGPAFALLGDPVDRSRSPSLHGRWMARDDCAGVYVSLRVGSEQEFRLSVDELARRGFRGVNVTHPWKIVAIRIAGIVAPAARSVGCANTLTLKGGTIEADNTDLSAVGRRLDELQRAGAWDGRHIVVIGGGGAARAALAAARTIGASRSVTTRRPESMRSLASEFEADLLEPGQAVPDGSLVIHATPVGLIPGERLSIPLVPLVAKARYMLDFVYSPLDDTIRRACAKAEVSYEDGSRLFLYQASESYRDWFGRLPPGFRASSTTTEAS